MKAIMNLLLAVLLISFVGCTKYEDGPGFSLKTKKARITNTWKMEKYVYDNGTSTTDVDEGKMTLNKDMSASMSIGTGGFSISGTWDFIDDKGGVRLTFNVLNTTTNKEYTILRLKSKELWVYDKDGKVELHLVPA